MRSNYILFLTACLATGWLTACQNPVEEIAVPKVDSLITIHVPDILKISANSITPKGAIDQLVRKLSIRYSPASGIYSDSVRIQILYDSLGRVTGYQQFAFGQTVTNDSEAEQIAKQAKYGVVYEYKNNQPYRFYRRGRNDELKPAVEFIFMSEYVYANTGSNLPTLRKDYYANLAGAARLDSQYELIYDSNNNLLESRDVNKYFVGTVYSYENNNLISNQSMDPKDPITKKPSTITRNEYDQTVNPMKGVLWDGGNESPFFTYSANNVIRVVTTDYDPNSTIAVATHIQKFSIDYNEQHRIVHRSTIINNSLEDIGRVDYLYRYGK